MALRIRKKLELPPDPLERLHLSCQAALRPEPVLTVSEWADNHRVLAADEAEPGPWRTARTPYLKEIMDCLSSTSPVERIVFMKGSQLGGPLALDTLVATTNGWTTMGEIEEGTMVFDERGRPARVVGVSEIFTKRQCFRVTFSDGSVLVADGEHLWTVDDERGHTSRRRTVCTAEIAATFKIGKIRNRYAISVTAPLELPCASLPIPPYTLGVWLGDGSASSNRITTHIDDAEEIAAACQTEGITTRFDRRWSKGKATEIVLDPNPRDRSPLCIRGHDTRLTGVMQFTRRGRPATRCAECYRQRYRSWKYGEPADPVVRPLSFGAQIRRLGLFRNKHIPSIYLRASRDQRLSLLRGLMDTDGSITKQCGRCELGFVNRRLTAGSAELLQTLGIKCRVIERISSRGFSGKARVSPPRPYWRIDFMAYAEDEIFRLHRKAARLRPHASCRITETKRRRIVGVDEVASVPVRCIEVDSPSNLFLAGQAMIPTHNTEAGNCWIGYVIHHAPGRMLAVQPTTELAKRNSKTRIEKLISSSPELSKRVLPPRTADNSNTILSKEFPGGILVMTGANSAVGLRSMPARYLFLDEVDGYPSDVDGEGDPVALAVQRTVTFRGKRKIFILSTPSIKGFSRIERVFGESDRRYYFVPCPHCGDLQPLKWKGVKWDKGAPEKAWYKCVSCERGIAHHEKLAMLDAGEWQATAEGDGNTAGFHLSSLYSPWLTWGDIAVEFTKAGRDPTLLQPWANTKLAESFENKGGETIDAEGLMERREDWGDKVPEGVGVITCGIDVQDDRLELEIIGWGRDEESWSLDYRVIYGDPATPVVWSMLEEILLGSPKIDASCLDTGGHNTMAAYRFAAEHSAQRVWAIKGAAGKRPIWPRRPSRSNKGKVNLFLVGVDSAKENVYSRLRAITEPGPGYCHFPMDRDSEYFDQLTAEHVRVKYRRGYPTQEWFKPEGRRNEALDCRVYGFAALHGLIAMGLRLNRRVTAVAGRRGQDAGSVAGSGTAAVDTPRPKRRRVVRSSYMD